MIVIHVTAGLIALVSGAVAMFALKGSPLHRRSGMAFAIAMIVLTTSALVIAGFLRPHRVNVVAATLTFYLVGTGVLTMRRSVEEARGWLLALMAIALMGSWYAFSLGFEAMASAGGNIGGVPAPPIFMFAMIGLAGGLLDARLLLAGSIQGSHRLARHLWRMSFAMWIATTSFFLGQGRLFPDPVRKSGLLAIPVLMVTVFGIYWLARVLWRGRAAARVESTSASVTANLYGGTAGPGGPVRKRQFGTDGPE